MKALIDGLKSLGWRRLAALGVVALVTLATLAAITLTTGNAHMALLYADLDPREAGQITAELERQHIAYRLDPSGSEIMVADEEVSHARLLLARNGLPSGGTIGYEIFDRGDSLTANQFQQAINQTRAMEGELARTIRMISGVRAARVHLVLPRREPFARDQQEAQASVMLTMAGAGRLDHEGVQAILTLIAAAVPGLRPQNIAVIDSRGNLLARAGEPVGDTGAATGEDDLRRATEVRIARAVEEMLESSLGPGRVRAQASIEMDFDQVHETQERYDPDQQVIRSTQSVTDGSHTTEANAPVSVQNNLPNADAGATPAGSQENRQEETTNYEIGKTVRTLVREHPQIRRISLAVLVDGAEENGADGKVAWRARSPEELQRITSLVRGAIGYDEKRGDHVEIVNMHFAGDADAAGGPMGGKLPFGLEKADLMRLAQIGLIALVAMAALLLVLRPMMKRVVATLAPPPVALAATPANAGLLPRPSGSAVGQITGPPGSELIPDESMVSISNVEGQMRASSIRLVAELVDKHPEEALAIMRGWMQEEKVP